MKFESQAQMTRRRRVSVCFFVSSVTQARFDCLLCVPPRKLPRMKTCQQPANDREAKKSPKVLCRAQISLRNSAHWQRPKSVVPAGAGTTGVLPSAWRAREDSGMKKRDLGQRRGEKNQVVELGARVVALGEVWGSQGSGIDPHGAPLPPPTQNQSSANAPLG